jgi:hypothetical protein
METLKEVFDMFYRPNPNDDDGYDVCDFNNLGNKKLCNHMPTCTKCIFNVPKETGLLDKPYEVITKLGI